LTQLIQPQQPQQQEVQVRGARGPCGEYGAIGVVELKQDAKQVFEFMRRVEEQPSWNPGVKLSQIVNKVANTTHVKQVWLNDSNDKLAPHYSSAVINKWLDTGALIMCDSAKYLPASKPSEQLTFRRTTGCRQMQLAGHHYQPHPSSVPASCVHPCSHV
jgi:hypothetical protein